MVASDVCPTEEAVNIFLDHLVDPLLPARTIRDTPSKTQQQLVAKQVHAVVLLYNYYHRKQYPQLKFEDFESFCKLAVVQKPTLLAHMKLMQRSNDCELNDLEKQLSVTEKAVMDACEICNSLDASKDVPSTEGWPISKIAVLLIDSKKDNCFLQFGSITQGVWSLIEKDVDVASCLSEGSTKGKHIKKKIKVTRKSLRDGVNEDCFRQAAFSAVEEATGINPSDLTIIGGDVVYSLSKEKTIAQFYVMQCTQPKNDDVIQTPVNDAFESLQGPLVVRSSGQWTVTPAVCYFHLLPYAGIMSDWLSREGLSDSFQDQRVELGNMEVSQSKRTEPCEPDIHDNQNRSDAESDMVEHLGSSIDTNTKSLKQANKNGRSMYSLSGDGEEPQSVNVDALQKEDKCENIDNRVQLDNHQNMMNSYEKPISDCTVVNDRSNPKDIGRLLRAITSKVNRSPTSSRVLTRRRKLAEMAGSIRMPCSTASRGENAANKKATGDMACSDEYEKPVGDYVVVTDQSKFKDIGRLQSIVSSKENMSRTALRVLLTRRNKLTLQQREIEDKMAVCDKKIQAILNSGEDDSGLKLESLEEDCNDICSESLFKPIKMNRLSEAILVMKNSCQELDDICYENNWRLPTYRVSPSDGGFQSQLTVKGIDFDCSIDGDSRSNPREARESAATQMLEKLRSMASDAQ